MDEHQLLIKVFGSKELAMNFLHRAKKDKDLIGTLEAITGAKGYSFDCLDDLIYEINGNEPVYQFSTDTMPMQSLMK